MTCSKAMFTDVVSATPDDTVDHALNLLAKHGIRSIPVLDSEGVLTGFFHFRRLLVKLLPFSGETDLLGGTAHGGLIDHDLRYTSVIGSEAELNCSERLSALLSARLKDVTDTDFELAHPDTPLMETIRILIKYRGPLPVVNKGEKKLIALVTVQSVIQALKRIAVEK